MGGVATNTTTSGSLRLRTLRRPGFVRAGAIAVPLLAALICASSAVPVLASTGLPRFKNGPIAISQDGSTVWAVNPDNDTVTRIAAGPDTVLAQVAVGKSPRNLAISPDGSEVWVTNYESNTVSVISTASSTVIATIPTLYGPFGVVFRPNGTRAYVVNQLSDSLLTFDPPTRTVVARQRLGHRPRAIAITSDGSRLMVQNYISFQTLMQTNFFDAAGGSLSAAFQVLVSPIPQGDGGYPGVCQAIAVAPGDTTLWIPVLDVNPQNGAINFPGTGQLTLNSTLQAVVREVRISSRVEIPNNPINGRRKLNTAGANVQMPADVAFTSDGTMAYIPCSFSNDVLKINTDTNPPTTLIEIPVGDFPNGIVISPTQSRAYVTNYLSRNVTVIDTQTDAVIDTIETAPETLPANILNGKKLFNTSTGKLSTDARIACAGCHPEGGQDAANWDFSHFGDGKRNTQNLAGIGLTPPFHTIGDRDEIQDFEFNIQVLHFGEGLADGPDNPVTGAPNAGRSQDLDDMAAYIASIPIRPESPFRDANQDLMPAAANGKAIFESEETQCKYCHPEPLYTDRMLHDVGTFLANDTTGYQGFVTPTLRAIFDTDPYLHTGNALSLQPVLVSQNVNDQHGKTSHLTTPQKDDLTAYLNSIIAGKEDTTPPGIEYARAVDVTEVIVRFLEPVDPVTGTDISRYAIDNGVSVLSASVDPFSSYMGRDHLTVHLFTTPHTPGPTYTVTVSGVKDQSMNGNQIVGGQASYGWSPEASFTFTNNDTIFTSRLGRDTRIELDQPTWNFGKSDELKVGVDAATSRSIVRFDFYSMLSTVLADTSDIVSAKIRLRLKGQASADPVKIYSHRLLKYFVEGSGGVPSGQPFTNQTNWNSAREGRLAWSSAGAAASAPGVEGYVTSDYLSAYDRAYTPEDSADVSVVGDLYEWDVTSSIKWAFAHPYYYNFGYLLVAETEGASTEKVFHSLEDPSLANRPSLEITIRSDAAVAVGEGAGAQFGYALFPSRPNPTVGPSTISFQLPKSERVTLRLFDVSGRAVRTLAEGSFGAGRHDVAWDGRNESGVSAAAGSYFYRIKAGRWTEVGRLQLLR